MEWLNGYGLLFMLAVMVPNLIFAITNRDGFENKRQSRAVELLEQIGRFGCFGFMVINVPGICFGWRSETAFVLYLTVDAVLVSLYCLIWAVFFRKSNVFRALSLSVLPSVLFLFSGVASRSVPLLLSALLFAPCHIWISYQNAK